MTPEDIFPHGDSKYRSYTAQVDKSLKGFEYSTEWADLISALVRLIKVFQSNAKTNYIPRSFLVGKRLAQCLHPALPPGVHYKALECYDIIFHTIGPHQTAIDLPVYGSGLFALLGPSAMTVKPPLFDIFEEHFLPLGTALNPAFIGLLQGLLPGLEPGAEFSERGNRTIEMFSGAVGPKFFYTCLWKLLIHIPSVRYFGISFIMSHFNRRKPLKDQEYIYGCSKELLVESLCCLFSDSVILVQRDALDFLQLALPIHSYKKPDTLIAGSSLSKVDLTELCRAALSVLLRRDASLNRRLFNWLKGSQLIETSLESGQPLSVANLVIREDGMTENVDNSDAPNASEPSEEKRYFEVYSRDILIDAVRQLVHSPACPILENPILACWSPGTTNTQWILDSLSTARTAAERPFRILTGLLDRSDLGGSIIETLLIHILWYIYTEYHTLKEHSVLWANGETSLNISPSVLTDYGFGDDAELCNMLTGHATARNDVKFMNILSAEQRKTTDTLSGQSPLNGADLSDLFEPPSPAQTRRTESAIHQTERRSSLYSLPKLKVAEEFLRSAYLFVSNLDASFFWGFVEMQFNQVLCPLVTDQPLSEQPLTIDRLCRIMAFLITCLPLHTYPGVCGRQLPHLMIHIIQCLVDRMETAVKGDNQMLTAPEFASLLSLFDALVNKALEHVMSHFDKAINRMSTVSGLTNAIPATANISQHSQDELYLFASMIGKYRAFVGVFFTCILKFPPARLSSFFHSIQLEQKIPPESSPPSPTASSTADSSYANWLDIFANVCRILLHLSTFPFLLSDCSGGTDTRSNPIQLIREAEGDLVTSSNSTVFCEQISPNADDKDSGEVLLPYWLICLLYAATELQCFDMKAISLYTFLELFYASTSIHGWSANGGDAEEVGNDNPSADNSDPSASSDEDGLVGSGGSYVNKMRLTLPVLSAQILSHLMRKTTLFLRLGVSLWAYLSPTQSVFHEDAVNLLLRLHQLIPPIELKEDQVPGRIGNSLEAFMLSQMLSADLNTRVDAQLRFATLWHMMRYSPLIHTGCPNQQSNIGGCLMQSTTRLDSKLERKKFFKSIAASCWRHLPLCTKGFGAKSCSLSAVPPNVPFYRCVLLLLDNLDIDSPWDPTGPSNVTDLVGTNLNASINGTIDSTVLNADYQFTGLMRSVLREQTIQWIYRSLRTGQVDRLIAPLLAALLHPATVRLSLKAHVISELRNSKQHDQVEDDSSQPIPDILEDDAEDDHEMSHSPLSEVSSPSDGSQRNDGHTPSPDMMSALQRELQTLHSASTRKQGDSLDAARRSAMSNLLDQLLDPSPHVCPKYRAAPSMLPLHEHIVVYLQSHDVNQMVYAFSRIRSLLLVAPKLFVLSLYHCTLRTSNGASYEPHGTSLHLFGLSLVELLTRHRRALAGGGNFYQAATADELQETIQYQANLLEVLINLCLIVMCSQLACGQTFAGSRCEFNASEFRANKSAQKAAADVLELIVKELAHIQKQAATVLNGHSRSSDGYVLVDSILNRTCLFSTVLHCLASAVEMSHLPSEVYRSFTNPNSFQFKKLPSCFRLLLINEQSANLPKQFHTIYLSTLLRLSRAVLDLKPWSADAVKQIGLPMTLWPYKEFQSHPANGDASRINSKDYLCMLTRAFDNLPNSISNNPILKSCCLTVHMRYTPNDECPTVEQSAMLLDVLRLALSAPSRQLTVQKLQHLPPNLSTRRDLHPIWYQFIFATLSSYGVYTPQLTRIVIKQICSNLSTLTANVKSEKRYYQLCHDSPDVETNTLSMKDIPTIDPDYILASLACLQGIYHAFLLPGGLSTPGDVPGISALAGFPDKIANSAFLSKSLSNLNRENNKRMFVAVDNTGEITDSDLPESTALVPPPTATVDLNQSSTIAKYSSASSEVLKTPGGTVEANTQNFNAIYTNRTRELIRVNDTPDPEAHPLVQAQTELFSLLPTVFTSIASIWEALNRFSSFPLNTEPWKLQNCEWSPDTISITQLPVWSILGNPRIILPSIRLFIQPLATQHPAAFLINMALAWPSNLLSTSVTSAVHKDKAPILHLLTPINRAIADIITLPLLPKQSNLLQLLSGYTSGGGDEFVPILPAETLIVQLRNLIRRPWANVALSSDATLPASSKSAQPNSRFANRRKNSRNILTVRLQVNLLHMFYALLIRQPKHIPVVILLSLLRDLISLPVSNTMPTTVNANSELNSASLPPVAVFILTKIFNIFLNMAPMTDDRREQRELQELCHRVLESIVTVAASGLEQPTWFRRAPQVLQPKQLQDIPESVNLAHHGGPLTSSKSATDLLSDDISFIDASSSAVKRPSVVESIPDIHRTFSTTLISGEQTQTRGCADIAIQAMDLLSEHMAIFLDLVYKSDEKDRIPAFMTSILTYVYPYLRVRTTSNSHRYDAASKLLASVSSYQYTRRAWRKECLDFFLEPAFFQIGPTAMQSWNIIIDNLMTQDKSTFREALGRLTFTQPAGLNLFSNKETEHDMRATSLKKISYIIYASEVDQYCKAMPDLLERLADCLRLGQGVVPQVHNQVFVFARTLISRMSAIQLTSLWPIIIPELMVVFKLMSRCIENICCNKDAKNKPIKKASPKELAMYLSACKFLATGLIVPEQKAPQFCFYEWIFVDVTTIPSSSGLQEKQTTSDVVSCIPLVTEVAKFLRQLEVKVMSDESKLSGEHLRLSQQQACLNVLSMRKLNDLLELRTFIYSLFQPSVPNSAQQSSTVDRHLFVDLAIEAALMQEFPEHIAPR